MFEETKEYFQLLDHVTAAVRILPNRAATMAVNFSKERFRAQNWLGNTAEPWPKRKSREKRPGRTILIDTGRLRRSIHKIIVTSDYAIIGTDVPYARAHNDGFKGPVTVRQHNRENRKREGRHIVRAHTKNMNLPRRRFIGPSSALDKQLVNMMTIEIAQAIKGI